MENEDVTEYSLDAVVEVANRVVDIINEYEDHEAEAFTGLTLVIKRIIDEFSHEKRRGMLKEMQEFILEE